MFYFTISCLFPVMAAPSPLTLVSSVQQQTSDRPSHFALFGHSTLLYPLLPLLSPTTPGPIQLLTRRFLHIYFCITINRKPTTSSTIMVNSPSSSIITAKPNLYTTVPHCTTNFLPVLSFDLLLDVCVFPILASYIFAFRSSLDAIE